MGKITDEAAFRVCASAKLVDQNGNGAMNYIVAPYLIDDLRDALAAADALTAGESDPVGEFLAAQTKTDADIIVAALSHRSDLYLSPYTSPPASELEALRKERDESDLARDALSAQLDAAEAQRDEALKALDLVTDYLAVHHFSSERDRVTEMVLTARRVRDGGKADV